MIAATLLAALYTLAFPEPQEVANRASIADFYPVGKRCGIYVLCFANDDIYIGQASDIVRRHAQHRQTYKDITSVTFKRVLHGDLDAEERRIIWSLEQQGYRLRNITFTSMPKGESDFDLVMPVAEQESWLRGAASVGNQSERAKHEVLRGRYREKYARFFQQRDADIALDILRAYVHCGIPAPSLSEVSFWACSCLPAYHRPNVTIYSRINVNW